MILHQNNAKKTAGKQRKLLQVKISYNRVLEKVKDIRRKFSSGLINGTRSGSGKIVWKHFDLLKQIFGNAPSDTKIPASFNQIDRGLRFNGIRYALKTLCKQHLFMLLCSHKFATVFLCEIKINSDTFHYFHCFKLNFVCHFVFNVIKLPRYDFSANWWNSPGENNLGKTARFLSI